MSDFIGIVGDVVSVRGMYRFGVDKMVSESGARFREVHGCYRSTPLAHPWIPEIKDVACGADERMTDAKCTGCHRQREESPLDQLQALDARHTEDGIAK